MNEDNAKSGFLIFMPSENLERLIQLRESDPHAFMLQTSEATRNALLHYERLRESARRVDEREAGEVES